MRQICSQFACIYQTSMFKPTIKLQAGEGHLHLTRQDCHQPSHFNQLSSRYPLKLLSPTAYLKNDLQSIYMLNYGGGLVHGDRINLTIKLDPFTSLLALTQGSTKGL